MTTYLYKGREGGVGPSYQGLARAALHPGAVADDDGCGVESVLGVGYQVYNKVTI